MIWSDVAHRHCFSPDARCNFLTVLHKHLIDRLSFPRKEKLRSSSVQKLATRICLMDVFWCRSSRLEFSRLLGRYILTICHKLFWLKLYPSSLLVSFRSRKSGKKVGPSYLYFLNWSTAEIQSILLRMRLVSQYELFLLLRSSNWHHHYLIYLHDLWSLRIKPSLDIIKNSIKASMWMLWKSCR